MRRLIAYLSALGLLGAMLGCDHTAGICDCDQRTHGCPYCCGNIGMSHPAGMPVAPSMMVPNTPPPPATAPGTELPKDAPPPAPPAPPKATPDKTSIEIPGM